MEILETIFPVIAIALAGYGAVVFKKLTQGDADALSKFVFTFPIPCGQRRRCLLPPCR